MSTGQHSPYNELDDLVNKGIELYNLGDYEDAIKMYNKALDLDPNNIMLLANIGLFLSDPDN